MNITRIWLSASLLGLLAACGGSNTPTNQAPTAVADTIEVNEGDTVTVLNNGNTSVLQNDTDPESDSLTAELVQTASNGTLTLNDDGTFEYVHNGEENTIDNFTYRARDASSSSNVVTVNINITAQNDPPQAVDDNIVVAPGGTTTTLADNITDSVIANDIDPDGPNLTVTLVNGPATDPNFNLNSDGTFSYTHDGSNTLVDNFTYSLTDNAVGTTPVTGTVNININASPIANDDDIVVVNGGTVSTLSNPQGATSVLQNDTDTDTLTVRLINGPTNAAINGFTLNPDGTFSYTHNGGTETTDSFTYVANDGFSDSAEATVNIAVTTNISGVWTLNLALVPNSESPANCASDERTPLVVSVKQTPGATAGFDDLEVRTHQGALLNGQINLTTGEIALSGSNTGKTVDFDTNNEIDFKFDVSVDNANKLVATNSLVLAANTGIINTQEYLHPNGLDQAGVLNCSFSQQLALLPPPINAGGLRVYQPVGNEGHDGVYGLELFDELSFPNGESTERAQLPAQIEIVAQTINLYFLNDPNSTFNIISNTYDPTTGYFEFEFSETFATINGRSEFSRERITGIFLGGTNVNGISGLPLLALGTHGYSQFFAGDVGTGTIDSVQRNQGNGYGNRMPTRAFTRTGLVRQRNGSNDRDAIIVGVFHPPFKRLTDTSRLYLQVIGQQGELCNTPYIDTGNSIGRYRETHILPIPDISQLLRQDVHYGRITCNTSAQGTDRVTHGEQLTVQIIDSGADGLLDGNNDVRVWPADANQRYSANVVPAAQRFTTNIGVSEFTINGGSRPDNTFDGNVVPILGYFDKSKSITFNWNAHPEIGTTDPTARYQLRIQDDIEPFVESRLVVDPDINSITIPQDTLSNVADLRLTSVDDQSFNTTDQARRIAFARHLELMDGVRGTFNINIPLNAGELNFVLTINAVFSNGNWTCLVDLANTSCSGIIVDKATDTVTMLITDNNGPTTLSLAFSQSNQATATYGNDTGTATLTYP